MQSLNQLLKEYNEFGVGQRLGQYFCNNYIAKPWPELFYSENYVESTHMISKWLEDHQYIDLPPRTLMAYSGARYVKAR